MNDSNGWKPPGDAGRDVILRATDSLRAAGTGEVVTRELLDERVAIERRRYARYMCWLGSVFMVVSALLLSVGLVVVAESRRAIKDVSNIENKTDRALVDIGDVASNVKKVDMKADDISEALASQKDTYKADRAELLNDLRRLSSWYDSKYTSMSNVLVEAGRTSTRLDEIERMEQARATRFAEIEEWFQREYMSGKTSAVDTVASADIDTQAMETDSGPVEAAPLVETAPVSAGGVETVNYSDGSTYSGTIVDGRKHGTGRFVFANGDEYAGEFRNDLREGRGVYHYASGARYDGEFLAGKRQGAGTYVYANGDEFTGTFKAGRKDGPGLYVYSDGTRVTGIWKNDVLVDQ